MLDAEIRRFLQNISPAMPIWQRYRDQTNQMKVYRGADQRMNGLVVFSTNRVHPHALGMTVATQDPVLFPKILTESLRRAAYLQKDRLVTWEYPPLSRFAEWLLTQGFTVWRQTVMPTANLRAIVPNSVTPSTRSLRAVLADATLKGQLTERCLRDYRRGHLVNPMVPMTVAAWEHEIFPGVIPTAPLVSLRQGRIVAYTFPFEDTPGTLNLAWLGARRARDLWSLQGAQIQWAQQHAFQRLAGEFDSTDQLAWDTARHWPFEPAPVYLMIGKRLD